LRRPKRYTAVAVAAALALAVCLFALTRREPAATLRTGYAEFLPYVGIDESGNPAGLAVQVVQQAAKRTGIRVQWVEVEDAEKALREGLMDLYPILTVSAERKQSFYVSAPWWESSQSLLSLRERPLKNPAAAVGRRIAIRDSRGLPTGRHGRSSRQARQPPQPRRNPRPLVSASLTGVGALPHWNLPILRWNRWPSTLRSFPAPVDQETYA
jgi:hypothetical protein